MTPVLLGDLSHGWSGSRKQSLQLKRSDDVIVFPVTVLFPSVGFVDLSAGCDDYRIELLLYGRPLVLEVDGADLAELLAELALARPEVGAVLVFYRRSLGNGLREQEMNGLSVALTLVELVGELLWALLHARAASGALVQQDVPGLRVDVDLEPSVLPGDRIDL